MKKSKRVLSAILCVAALTGAFTFTACGNKGDKSDESNGSDQTEHVPVTTVANEEEWKKALDLLSLNSFTVFEADHYEALTDDDVTKINGVVDMTNCKAEFTVDRKGKYPYHNYRYFEFKNNTFWEYDSSAYEEYGVYDTPTTEEGAKDCLKELLTSMETNRAFTSLSILTNPIFAGATDGEAKAVKDLFSEFNYENGYYNSNLLIASDGTFSYKIELAIKDGVLSEAKIKTGEKEVIEWLTLKVTDVNSTVVTASSDARTAIDAEKEKG